MKNNADLKETKEVISTIIDWKIQAESGHNDGWIRQFYVEKLQEVKDVVCSEKNPIRVIT